jgi:hypothetical protein
MTHREEEEMDEEEVDDCVEKENEDEGEEVEDEKKITTITGMEPTILRTFKTSNLLTTTITIYWNEDDKERKIKSTLPIFDGSRPETLLYCVNRLYAIALQKRYQDKHFWEVFPQTLQDSALEEWYTLYEDLDEDQEEDKALFDATVKKFIKLYFHDGTRHHWIECIRNFSAQDKPAGMSTLRLITRLKTIKQESKLLPSTDGEEITDNMIRDAVFHMASQHDQAIITRRFHGDYTKATLEQLQSVLTVEERIQNTFTKKLKASKPPNKPSKKAAPKKKNQSSKLSRENEKGKAIKYGPNAKCLRHPNGSHTWGDCRLNPRSANFDPNAVQRGNNHWNNQNNNQGNQNYNQRNQNNNHDRAPTSSYGGPTHQGHYHWQSNNNSDNARGDESSHLNSPYPPRGGMPPFGSH